MEGMVPTLWQADDLCARTASHHILGPFADKSRGTTLLNTDRGQCCSTFSVLMGTELVHAGLIEIKQENVTKEV